MPNLACLQEHLGEVLPAILDGLADEAEGVRDAALAAGRTAVELYAQVCPRNGPTNCTATAHACGAEPCCCARARCRCCCRLWRRASSTTTGA